MFTLTFFLELELLLEELLFFFPMWISGFGGTGTVTLTFFLELELLLEELLFFFPT